MSKSKTKRAVSQSPPPAKNRPAAPSGMPFGAPLHEIILALGLGALIFLRPWIDGITYPERNTYFVWLAAGLFALWSTRLVFSREEIRYPRHIALLGAFFVAALVTGLASVQFSATYRALLNWVAYFMIFTIAASGLRSRAAVAIVLGFFVLTSFAETAWSILHVEYLMPMTRKAAEDPVMLQRYFNTSVMTPEIRSRIESNRANGSLLFANALACWILVAIPFAVGAAAQAFLRLRVFFATGPHAETEPGQDAAIDRTIASLFVALFAGFGIFVCVATYYSFFFAFAYPKDVWTNHLVRWTIYCIGIPALAAVWSFVVSRRHGTRTFLLEAQCIVLAILFFLQIVGLGYTYSRGGMLATAAALGLGGWLLRSRRREGAGARGSQTAIAAVLMACAFSAGLYAAWIPADAGEGPPRAEPGQPSGAAQPGNSEVDLKGVNPSFDAMMDPTTAFLRLSYWKSGLNMALANPLTGVGLGNFGAAYPKYQLPNSADVKQAHNDYLQTFCETGVVGGLLFLLFWGYFFAWGIRRILREADWPNRWLLTGVFCAVAGFAFHSAVDFNFSNPSLATLVFLMAGLFLALAADPATPALPIRKSPMAGAPLLLAAAIAVGAGYRVYRLDSVVGNDLERKMRFEVANALVNENSPEGKTAGKPRVLPDRFVAMLIPSRDARESFGKLYVRIQPNSPSARPLGPQEALPEDAMLVVMNPNEARVRAMERIPLWLDRFIDADSRFPYDPTVSTYIYQWCDLLYALAKDPQERLRLAEACLHWAEECVKRSPEQVAYRNLLARALWRRGEVETTTKQLQYYDRAIEEFANAIERYPIRPDLYFDYGRHCIAYGEERQRAGDAKGGHALIDKGNAAVRKGEELKARQAGS